MVRATGLEPARFWQWNLNPPSLPIPPCPHIHFFILPSCCGARQPLHLTKQACVLPTAATRSGRFNRHRRRSHRSPLTISSQLSVFVSCCGTRQPLRLSKQACVLPTAATRSPPSFLHRRRSGRSPDYFCPVSLPRVIPRPVRLPGVAICTPHTGCFVIFCHFLLKYVLQDRALTGIIYSVSLYSPFCADLY